MTEVALRCTCGQVRGTAQVGRSWENRAVCMCRDCQAFAHWLGRADDLLDEFGGTDLFQLTPSAITLTEGHESVRCMRLSPKGLMRWYSACCNTPLGNTMADAGLPFVGVPHLFMDHAANESSRDADLGPVHLKVQAKDCPGPKPEDAYEAVPFRAFPKYVLGLVVAKLRGHARPHPFFTSDGKPVFDPKVLSREERQAVTP